MPSRFVPPLWLTCKQPHTGGLRGLVILVLATWVLQSLSSLAVAQEPAQPSLKELFWSGRYSECAQAAKKVIEADRYNEDVRVLLVASELELGQFDLARKDIEESMEQFRASIRLKWLAAAVYRYHSKELATNALKQLRELLEAAPYRYSGYEDQLIAGRFLLSEGLDPKKALDAILAPMKRRYPEKAGAFLAAGDLALEKQDFALAAQNYAQAAKLEPGNPDAHFGVAKSFAPSDDKKAELALQEALRLNPRHVPSLLFVIDQQIDAERFDLADAALAEVDKVNSQHPIAAAYRAVIAHLRHQPEKEKEFRDLALIRWIDNTEIDHLIGAKLSRNYRFAEGRGYQESALAMDANYAPAKLQLAQDLLRLGEEEKGWNLAKAAYEADGYSVIAHNLVTLQESLAKYRSIEADGFILRMDSRESEVYGSRVLDLLKRAKETLCAKYDVKLEKPVVVEMFAKQQDFAVRTFGMPGGAGFLGVCFGNVITANSPVAQGASESNWESTLWHEFCHVVTLNKTHSKMPRWLSEGISVYEERQVHPSWGEQINPRYREMLLGKELTPVSQLSGAFMRPASPMHLQFAYFESSLVVEYLVEKYGLEMIKQVLTDLGAGLTVNEALGRHAGGIEALDKEFAEYAHKKANEMAPKADWSTPEFLANSESEEADAPGAGGRTRRPTPKLISEQEIRDWLTAHENNYPALLALAKSQLESKRFAEAKVTLDKLAELYPSDSGASSPLILLAGIYREEKNSGEERKLLERYAQLADSDLDAFLRLAEVSEEAKDWNLVKLAAQKALAVNPMLPAPHRSSAKAAEETSDDPLAIASYGVLLKLDPFDVAELEFRLAKAYQRHGNLPAAKRHVLLALAEAPRYREAHQLLLEIEPKTTPPELPEEKSVDPKAEEAVKP